MPVNLIMRLVDALGRELPLPPGFPYVPYSNVIPREREHLVAGDDRYEVTGVDWTVLDPGGAGFSAIVTLRALGKVVLPRTPWLADKEDRDAPGMELVCQAVLPGDAGLCRAVILDVVGGTNIADLDAAWIEHARTCKGRVR